MPAGYGNWSKPTTKETKTDTTISRGFKNSKGRSLKTYQNKINQIKRKYRKLFNYSKKHKGNFHNRYPTVENYLKTITLKKPNINK